MAANEVRTYLNRQVRLIMAWAVLATPLASSTSILAPLSYS